MTFNRIKDITCKRDGTPYYKVSLSTKWVQHLKSQEQKSSNLTQEEIRVVSSFFSGITTPIYPSFLKQHIAKWCHHNQYLLSISPSPSAKHPIFHIEMVPSTVCSTTYSSVGKTFFLHSIPPRGPSFWKRRLLSVSVSSCLY